MAALCVRFLMANEPEKLLFGVRTLVSSQDPHREAGVRSFEERVVIIQAADFAEAITLGEAEAHRYVSEMPASWNSVLIDDVQAFEVAAYPIRPGDEVWSVIRCLRMSDNEFRDYLSRGDEVRELKSEPAASPSGGPATRPADPGASGGPPSLS